MKIILAIFAIACGAALFALWDGDPPLADRSGGIVAAVAGRDVLALPDQNGSEALAKQSSTRADDDRGADVVDVMALTSERLNRYSSIAALLRYRIQLFDSELIGSGLYQQAGQGSARQFRLELKTQLGESTVGRLQVCDGGVLWTYREVPGGPQLERIDLRRVRAAQRQAASAPPTSPVVELATGGLPKLLQGLRLNFRTLKAEAGYLGEAAMWAVELEWKPSVLAALAPDQQEHINAGELCDFAELPQLPERVMVFLGHEDLFPRRIEFRRRGSGSAGQGGAGEGNGDGFVPVVTVEFTDVQLNQPIDARQFEYGAAGATDLTEAFLQSRGLPSVR